MHAEYSRFTRTSCKSICTSPQKWLLLPTFESTTCSRYTENLMDDDARTILPSIAISHDTLNTYNLYVHLQWFVESPFGSKCVAAMRRFKLLVPIDRDRHETVDGSLDVSFPKAEYLELYAAEISVHRISKNVRADAPRTWAISSLSCPETGLKSVVSNF